MPPDRVLQALNRFDPLPLLPGLEGAAAAARPERAPEPGGARRCGQPCVKLQGTACGVGTQGSGWVVRAGLVATNAHVIAGHDGTSVLAPNGQSLSARPVYVDATNDIALLRVRGLEAAALDEDTSIDRSSPVALLGYPRNGPLTATAGTAGRPAHGALAGCVRRGTRPRVVVPLRGAVQPGESGGPGRRPARPGRGDDLRRDARRARRLRGPGRPRRWPRPPESCAGPVRALHRALARARTSGTNA